MCMENCNTKRKAGHAAMEIGKELYQSPEDRRATSAGMRYARERDWKGLLRRNETDWALSHGKVIRRAEIEEYRQGYKYWCRRFLSGIGLVHNNSPNPWKLPQYTDVKLPRDNSFIPARAIIFSTLVTVNFEMRHRLPGLQMSQVMTAFYWWSLSSCPDLYSWVPVLCLFRGFPEYSSD